MAQRLATQPIQSNPKRITNECHQFEFTSFCVSGFHYGIKAILQRSSKPRSTVAKQIRALVASRDYRKADDLSAFGHLLSVLESGIHNYYFFGLLVGFEQGGKSMKKTAKTPNTLDGDDLLKIFNEYKANICNIFLDAVNRYDADKILQIAEAVRFFKDHPPFTDVDPQRRWLIALKGRLEQFGETMSVREIAEYLNRYTKTKVPLTDDGYSSLRRQCKELQFPLTPSKKNRSK